VRNLSNHFAPSMFDKSILLGVHVLSYQLFFQSVMGEKILLFAGRGKRHEPAISDHSELRS
jgi:hypothetical protein